MTSIKYPVYKFIQSMTTEIVVLIGGICFFVTMRRQIFLWEKAEGSETAETIEAKC